MIAAAFWAHFNLLMRFDSQAFGPIFGPLLADAPLNELGPGTPDCGAAEKLGGLSLEAAFAPHAIADRQMADACLAGLWLMYDCLDESHRISQEIETPSGSYWHGIMHRREPDFDNAKYWFRRVGQHPIFGRLAEAAREIAEVNPADRAAAFLLEQSAWDPFRFVDLCAAAEQGRSDADELCRLVQQAECRLLFEFCHKRAV